MTTAIIALIVLIIIYLKLDMKYKKAAMAIFMIILISFGGIRAYEKMNAIDDNPVSGNFTYIAAYPTADMFTWTIVESDSTNSTYYSFKYNTLNMQKIDAKTVQSLTVTSGSIQSAQEAINKADELPEVQNFKWDAYYPCINASYNGTAWKLTYFDVVDTGYHNNNIKVVIPSN